MVLRRDDVMVLSPSCAVMTWWCSAWTHAPPWWR